MSQLPQRTIIRSIQQPVLLIEGSDTPLYPIRSGSLNSLHLLGDSNVLDSTYVAINGINTLASDDVWNNEAEIVMAGMGRNCHAFQYFSDTVFRRMFQTARVNRLNALCNRYIDFGLKIRLIGHSNGADLICRLLNTYSPIIDEVHLIAGASECDCNRNGINRAFDEKRLRRAVFYCSKKDSALKQAKLSKTLLGWAGFGYDYVGLVGPSNVRMSDNVRVVWRDDFNHGDWFVGSNLNWTLSTVCSP